VVARCALQNFIIFKKSIANFFYILINTFSKTEKNSQKINLQILLCENKFHKKNLS